MRRTFLLFVVVALVPVMVAPALAGGVAASEVTVDFTTCGEGVFDPLFYRADGIVFPPRRCGSDGCASWFVGWVQGDEALAQYPGLGPITARFTRPISRLSLQVAPGNQGTATYTLTAFGGSGRVLATQSLTVTQDTGDPATGPFGYFSLSLEQLPAPAKSFTLDSVFVRSSFGNTVIEYGVSSIGYTHWAPTPT